MVARGVVLGAIGLGVLAAGVWFGWRAPPTGPVAPVVAPPAVPSSGPASAPPAAPAVQAARPPVRAPASPPTVVPTPPEPSAPPPALAAAPPPAAVTAPATAQAVPAPSPAGPAIPPSVPAPLVTTTPGAVAPPSPIATAPPATPSPVAAPEPPRFDIVRVNPQGSTVLAGRAMPGAEVVVRSNGREMGRVQADRHGQWVLADAAPLPPGAHEITLEMHDATGRQVAGEDTVLAVVAPPPAPPAASAPPSATGAGTRTGIAPAPAIPPLAIPPLATPPLATPPLVVITTPQGAPTLLQGPARAGGTVRLGLEVVDYDNAGEIRFAGTAPAGTTVRVYIDDATVGDAAVGPDGRWTLVPRTRVAEGDHRLRLDQVEASGRVTVRIEQPFQRAAVAAAVAGDQRVVVQPRQNLWRISRHAYGRGVRYTEIYAANRDQIRDPALIYPGQVFTIPAATSAPATSPAAGGATPTSPSRSR